MTDMSWEEHQKWETEWWGDCGNTFAEESKQISYAYRMGLRIVPEYHGQWPVYNAGGKNILDIGGGPVSMLLKTFNFNQAVVVDPGRYPSWVEQRYNSVGITYVQERAELYRPTDRADFDEVWLYNCLQHTEDARQIAISTRGWGKVVRVFEWLDIPPCPGHPWELHRNDLDEWFQAAGSVEEMTGENGCWGTAYYGVFEGP